MSNSYTMLLINQGGPNNSPCIGIVPIGYFGSSFLNYLNVSFENYFTLLKPLDNKIRFEKTALIPLNQLLISPTLNINMQQYFGVREL